METLENWRETLDWAAEQATTAWSAFREDTLGMEQYELSPAWGECLLRFPEKEKDMFLLHCRRDKVWFFLMPDTGILREEGLEALEILAKAWISCYSQSFDLSIRGSFCKMAVKNCCQSVTDQILGEISGSSSHYFLSSFKFRGGMFGVFLPLLWGCDEHRIPQGELASIMQNQRSGILNQTTLTGKGLLYPGSFRFLESGDIKSVHFSSSLTVVYHARKSGVTAIGMYPASNLSGLYRNLYSAVNPGVWLGCEQIRQRCPEDDIVLVSVFGGANVLVHPTEKFQAGFNNWRAFDTLLHETRTELVRSEIGGSLCRQIHLDAGKGLMTLYEGACEKAIYDLKV
ncbi:MAG: hypothetical protein PHQ23_00580 [Candidatus Wallbacteria bacterium]|nr:hypothetical protein [Candidatus Wallbacteria bacterium]